MLENKKNLSSGDLITLKNDIKVKIQIKTITGYEVEIEDDLGILWTASIKEEHIK